MQFGFLLEQVVNGLVLGGYYLLIALGLSLIFSVGGVVNLAHGAFYALGAYVSVEITKYLGFGPAVVISPIAVAMLGILFERYILRRFYTADPILSLLVTFGLAMVAEQAIRIIWGAAPLSASIPPVFRGSVIVGEFLFSRYRVMLLAVVAVVLLAVWLLLHKTSFGRVVRAGIQRPDMVAALGIRLQPYMTAIVMLGVGMAAMGGAFFAPITIVHPAMGAEIITVAFVVVVIGGLGKFLGRRDLGAAGRRGARHHHSFRARRRRGLDLRADVPGPAGAAARAARRAHREIRMTTASLTQKYRPLLLAGLALVALPFVLRALGLSLNTGTKVVILAIAAMGLNLCVGYTGLVSFGHGTWFGIGAYAAGLIQLHWFGGEIWLPLLLSMVFVALVSAAAGVIILRRRGVYFSLLTLALAALTYTVAFRWSEVTGGEDGLGGLKRGRIGPFSLDNALTFYVDRRADRARRALRAASAVAIAVRPRAGGDPRKPAARHLPGLSGRTLQARRVRDLGGGDRACRRAARIPDLSRFGGSGLGAVFRRTAGDGGDRRHAQHAGAGARRAVLHPVPRTVFDLDSELAAVVRADLRRSS